MGSSRAIPIVVGVGDIKNRSQKIEAAIEPMKLMLQAIQAAINPTGRLPEDTVVSELQLLQMFWTPDSTQEITHHRHFRM